MVNEPLPSAEDRQDQKRRFEHEPRAVTKPERTRVLQGLAKRTRETAAAEGTRDAQQASKPVRTNEPEPCVDSERTRASPNPREMKLAPRERTRGV
jgi:hypothetical protein